MMQPCIALTHKLAAHMSMDDAQGKQMKEMKKK